MKYAARLTVRAAFILLAAAPYSASAQQSAPVLSAGQALVLELSTGTKVRETAADRRIEPASTAKLVTFAVIADALAAGSLRAEDTFPVSEHAWRTGGAPSGAATMFAALKSRISVGDLMKALAVQGANDAAIILAEGLSGSEQAFAVLMNRKAAELEMSDTRFVNATGLPAPGQATSISDLMRALVYLCQKRTDFATFYALPEFTWNKITQRNRNPLLQADVGASVFANAYSESDGYVYVGAFGREGRTFAVALSGMVSEQDRTRQVRELADWAIGSLRFERLFDQGAVVGTVPVQGGAGASVRVITTEPLDIMTSGTGLSARIAYEGPVIAPVAAGQPVGSIQVLADGVIARDVRVVAAEPIATGTLPQRAWEMLVAVVKGWVR